MRIQHFNSCAARDHSSSVIEGAHDFKYRNLASNKIAKIGLILT